MSMRQLNTEQLALTGTQLWLLIGGLEALIVGGFAMMVAGRRKRPRMEP